MSPAFPFDRREPSAALKDALTRMSRGRALHLCAEGSDKERRKPRYSFIEAQFG
jgi:hypothetical protein